MDHLIHYIDSSNESIVNHLIHIIDSIEINSDHLISIIDSIGINCESFDSSMEKFKSFDSFFSFQRK